MFSCVFVSWCCLFDVFLSFFFVYFLIAFFYFLSVLHPVSLLITMSLIVFGGFSCGFLFFVYLVSQLCTLSRHLLLYSYCFFSSWYFTILFFSRFHIVLLVLPSASFFFFFYGSVSHEIHPLSLHILFSIPQLPILDDNTFI